MVKAAKNALIIRYEILPYFYTLFYKSHTKGNTVIRPLFHEYPHDNETYSIDKQFLVGPAFLVTPVLEENKVSVSGYFPADNWYEYRTGKLVGSNENGKNLQLDAPIDFIPLHVRGGFILPTQEWDLTTEKSRKKPFGLIVAPNSDAEAQGDLFYDDGYADLSNNTFYYATFSLRDSTIKFNVEVNNYDEMKNLVLNNIIIFVRAPESGLKFILNNQFVSEDKIKIESDRVLLNNLTIKMTDSFQLEWTHETDITLSQTDITPVIDCLQQNEQNCTDKGCDYDAKAVSLPKCTIPTSKSGYKVSKNGSIDTDYELVKADSFSLFGNDIENLSVKVEHGDIVGSNGKRYTRIKVSKFSILFKKIFSICFNLNKIKKKDFLK